MDKHTCYEQAYKNGYEAGKKDALATDNNVGSKWIPVTSELPEPFINVLSYSGHQTLFEVDCVDEAGKWFSGYFSEYPVTHWMPLPEPPRGE